MFVDELCAKSKEPVKPKTVNAKMYSEMIKVQVGPAVKAVYPAGDAIFQDDGATIHRAGVALQAVKETFNHRLEPKDQANKLADV